MDLHQHVAQVGQRPKIRAAVDDRCTRAVIVEGPVMTRDREDEELVRKIEGGDAGALVELFARHRGRLRRMVQLRLDRRLKGRIDPSDVLQEAHLEVARRGPEYVQRPPMPPFLWVRFLTAQRLLAVHRHHFGAQMRDVAQEISLHHGAIPQAASVSLAEMLLGQLTSPTKAARRVELQLRLQDVLNSMEPIDREILTLRHFEELSNGEAAEVLGLSKTAASNRYMRALERLKKALAGMPGLLQL
jgi:RNA polymerase sigma-70 factor (ECF subfamily)